MKTQILLATTLLALTGTASATGSFTLQAADLQTRTDGGKPGYMGASSITVMYGR